MQAVASRATSVLIPSYIFRVPECRRTLAVGRSLLAGKLTPVFRIKTAKKCTTAAMKHDFVPVQTVEKRDDDSEAFKLRVISYNILAQCYIKSELFPYAPKNSLKWKNRSKMLEEELLSFDADFICLQELDMFDDFFKPLMEKHGYACLYKQRPNRKNDGCGIFYRPDRFILLERRDVDFNDLVPEEESPSEEPPLKLPRTSNGIGSGPEARIIEGVEATTSQSRSEPSISPTLASGSARSSIAAFEKSVGTSVASQLANLTERLEASGNGAPTKPAVKTPDLGGLAERLMRAGEEATAKAGSRVVRDSATAARYSKEHRLQRDCVAVMGAFRPVFGSRGAFVVANTHIYWDPLWIDVKLAQAEYLLYSLTNFLGSLTDGAREDVPVMLCGDFNSQPGDRVYRYLTSAKSPGDEPTVEGKARKVDIESAANKLFLSPAPLELFSAHERSGGEPPFTNFTPKFTGTLDHVFLTRPLVPCLVARKALPDRTEKDLGQGIPNQLYASDHLPIGFDFRIRSRDFT